MIWTIARRELADQLTSMRFLVVAFLVVGLTPLAVYVGTRDYINRLQDFNRLTAERQTLISRQPGKVITGSDDLFTPENDLLVLRVLRPPQRLSALVKGLDGILPQYWDYSSSGSTEGPPPTQPRRLVDALGQLDLEFLVRVVLGLLAVLLASDAVAGEKETGTLRMALSQPVSRSAFICGKLIGGMITILAPLISAFLVALLSCQILGLDVARVSTLARIGLLALAGCIYLLGFYALGLAISASFAGQKTALVVLLVIWVCSVLAAPPVSSLLARAITPVPATQTLEARKRALADDLEREGQEAASRVYREITGQPEDSVSSREYTRNKATIEPKIAPVLVEYINRRRRGIDELDRDAARRASRQNGIAHAIMILSPAALFANAASDLSGTGDMERLYWYQAIQRHEAELDQVLFEDPPVITFRSRFGSVTVTRRMPPTISDLPVFVPPRTDTATAMDAALPSLGLLGTYAGLFTLGAFYAFSRYDVR
ncbi:MAG TPA: ABC transporter permease [Acidobacteriota bacterium]|nr:ABC transporter permease [Acidobacteriota bacterium]